MIMINVKQFWQNIRSIFAPRNLIWHVVAIVSTYILVLSGFDWKYYLFFQHHTLIFRLMSLSTVLGFFVPLLVPLVLLWYGRKNIKFKITAFAVIQAEVLGTLVSGFYKVFTGRAHPELVEPNFFDVGTVVTNGARDISHQFYFGILHGGVIWGWPSTHTTVAFAMALVLITLFPQNKSLKWILLYAFYIGLGVAMSIHWFSDFFAGAIFGSLIGIIVGKNFKKLLSI